MATGTRNVLRFLGGALGTVASSAMMQAVLRSTLPDHLDYFADSTFVRPDMSLVSQANRDLVLHAYSTAIHRVFLMSAGLIAVCLVASAFVRDEGTKEKDQKGDAEATASSCASSTRCTPSRRDSVLEKEVDEGLAV